MENISFEEIEERARLLNKVKPNDTYHTSYIHFINYFSEKEELVLQDLIIGSNFTYAWMPTIMNFKSEMFDSCVEIINKAKKPERISKEDVLVLKGLVNNSLVGASKLLHFINPQVYAIWDSRVCLTLTGKSYKQKIEDINRFWSYLDLCNRITTDERFLKIHTEFVNKIGYQASPMRTIEQMLFIK